MTTFLAGRTASRRALMFLLILLGAAPLRAGSHDERILEGLYLKLAAVLAPQASPSTVGSLLVLSNPSPVIDPWSEDGPTDDDQNTISSLFDVVLIADWLSAPSGRTTSAVYKAILDHGELPASQQTAEQKKAVLAANAVLFVDGDEARGPTPAHAKYLELLQKLKKAREGGAAKAMEVKLLEQQLETVGHKNEIEAALERRRTLATKDLFQRAIERFRKEVSANGSARTGALPDLSSWSADSGWVAATISHSEPTQAPVATDPILHWHHYPSGWGLWTFGDEGATSYQPTGVKNLKVQVELKRVSIERPWLEPGVLRSSWRWKASAPDKGSVTSRTSPSAQPTGMLPCLVTQAILARSVRLTFDNWPSAERESIKLRVRRSQPTTFGPFSLAGTYAGSAVTFRARPTRTGFLLPDTQVLAWICQELPNQPVPRDR